jgi:hypothetical protein
VGTVPGIEEFVAEFTSEKAWGEDGYLTKKGFIPLPADERKEVQGVTRNDVRSRRHQLGALVSARVHQAPDATHHAGGSEHETYEEHQIGRNGALPAAAGEQHRCRKRKPEDSGNTDAVLGEDTGNSRHAEDSGWRNRPNYPPDGRGEVARC